MRSFQIALTFLTRIPLPQPDEVTAEEFTASQNYYAPVGMLIGLLLWALALAVVRVYPWPAGAALILIAEIVLTGGIHLDGFMDSMDGLLSARTPERMLEIMKDSRVGAHASISLVSLLLLKYALLVSLKANALSLVILMPLVSRWAFQIGIIWFPYARRQGLGKGFHESSRLIVFLLESVAVLALTIWLAGWGGALAALIAIVFVAIFDRRVARLLGGLTGDLYGATIELSEMVFLLAAIPLLR